MTTTPTPKQIQPPGLVVLAVVQAFKEAGPLGLPAGQLFAVLLTQGCTLSQFNEILGGLEQHHVIKRLPGSADHFAIVH